MKTVCMKSLHRFSMPVTPREHSAQIDRHSFVLAHSVWAPPHLQEIYIGQRYRHGAHPS